MTSVVQTIYNADAGINVVFDLFTGQKYSITLCVCVFVPTPGVLRTQMHVQVEVTVNTRPGNKSKTTSSPVSALLFIDGIMNRMRS